MASAAKWAVGLGAAAFTGAIGFTFTDPAWTQRKFHPEKVPAFKYTKPPSREECVKTLSAYNSAEHPLDVLVIGGGCVGCATALDASTRGLQVGLVEMGDYASETSSRSTKLIHGGVRYLEKAVFELDPMQLKLVAEALRERTVMLHQAPHLCKPLPTLIPCYHPYDLGLYWVGTKTYDFIAALFGGTIKYSGYVPPYETMNVYPKLRKTDAHGHALLGAVRYYDGQMNDARLCVATALTAACYGAATVNYTKATSMNIEENASGDKVVKTTMQDALTKKTYSVYSKAVVNAGGPFAGEVEKLCGAGESNFDMVPAAGTHIVIERQFCPKTHEAMIIPSSDGRVVFSIPWLGGCLLGTTDREVELTTTPKAPMSDVDFLLKNIAPYVGPVRREAVMSAWAGIRPLAKPRTTDKANTQSIVREHYISVDPDRQLLNITGGKWTTYREMAEQAVDQLTKSLLRSQVNAAPCISKEMVMLGARNLDAVPESVPEGMSLPTDIYTHWRGTYGDKLHDVLQIASADNQKLLKRLVPHLPVTEAEVVYAARNEHCEKVTDFISRRTRMTFVNADAAEAAIPRVTELMAAEKKWSRSTANAERSEAYAAMSMFRGVPDDATA